MRWIKKRNGTKPVRPVRRRWVWIFSSTAAAWLQALGALVALGLTLWMAQQARLEDQRKAQAMLSNFHEESIELVNKTYRACIRRDNGAFSGARLELDDLLQFTRAAQFDKLDSDGLKKYFYVRRTVLDTQEVLRDRPDTGEAWDACVVKAKALHVTAVGRQNLPDMLLRMLDGVAEVGAIIEDVRRREQLSPAASAAPLPKQ